MNEEMQSRFEGKFAAGSVDDCWIWLASLDNWGYGRIWDGARPRRAHRVSYDLYIGPIGPGLCVLHKCDNPACVNPHHLFLGTQQDNVADRVSKKRSSGGALRGVAHPAAKLSEQEVQAIRMMLNEGSLSQRAIARAFNISQPHVSGIKNGKFW